jgi:glutathione S-transferase
MTTLYGYRYSVYTRIARFALAEKGAPYTSREVNPFDPNLDACYGALHPFHRVPVLEHDGFRLYETAVITQFIDEAFDGPSLQPADPPARARMRQVIAVIDAYGYWPLVRQVFSHRVLAPQLRGGGDEEEIRAGLAESKRVLGALEQLADQPGVLDARVVSLADVHLAPMIGYFSLAPEGADLLAACPRLQGWWDWIQARGSFVATDPGLLPQR